MPVWIKRVVVVVVASTNGFLQSVGRLRFLLVAITCNVSVIITSLSTDHALFTCFLSTALVIRLSIFRPVRVQDVDCTSND